MALALAMLAGLGAALAEEAARMLPGQRVITGAERLLASGLEVLAGKRVGLITNHTGRVGGERLVDVLARASQIKLAAVLTPEHGLAGTAEAGAKVGHGTDAATGLPVHSLYGGAERPTPEMLAGLDVLVFDMQDIGARYYTYISTMGLAMQAAAAAGLPFVVLDRPNPLGGANVSGFVLERPLASFQGRFPIPQAHGMTVGELARMIKGERMLRGLERLDLTVIELSGWQRSMLWPDTGLAWVATSPNIPSFEAALVYAGTGLIEATVASEGRGTPEPFQLIGHAAIDARALAATLNAQRLPGVRFEPVRFTPRSIKGIATRPRFAGQEIPGVRIVVTDAHAYRPVETGIHVLAAVDARIRAAGTVGLIDKAESFTRLAGTRRLMELLDQGAAATAIIAAWQSEVAEFGRRRARYLLY